MSNTGLLNTPIAVYVSLALLAVVLIYCLFFETDETPGDAYRRAARRRQAARRRADDRLKRQVVRELDRILRG